MKKLGAVVSEAVDLQFVQAIAGRCGAQMAAAPSPEKLFESVSLDRTLHAFVTLEEILKLPASFFSRPFSWSNQVHLIAPKSNLLEARKAVSRGQFGSVCFRHPEAVEAAAAHYSRVVSIDPASIATGLAGLGVEPGKIQKFDIASSGMKNFATTAIVNELVAEGINDRIASIVSTSVDELLMNSMFDATVDQAGAQLLRDVPRSEDFNVSGVSLEMAMEKEYISFMVSDPVGQIDRGRVLSYALKKATAEQGENLIDEGREGAGIGLAQVFNGGGSLCFHTKTGSRTEVCLFFKRENRMSEFRRQFQFISTFIV